MADVLNTYSTFSADHIDAYIANEFYAIAEKQLVVGQLARKEMLPERMSTTIKLIRPSRINLPREALTEGVSPDAVAMSLGSTSVTLEQWGLVVALTDVSMITTKHPMLNIAIERSALAMAETLEREQFVTLMSGTNVFYPGTIAARTDITTTDYITTAVVGKAVGNLRTSGAPSFGGGIYKGVMHPQVEQDIVLADSLFYTGAQHANIRALQDNEIGRWAGVDWLRSNFMPLVAGVAVIDTAAVNATKSQYTANTTGGSLATGNYQIVVVGREVTTDYERRVSVQSGNLAITGPTGSFTIATPSSSNYTYDVYMTILAGTTPYKVKSRLAASATSVITAAPAGTEATPPAEVNSGAEVFMAFVFGRDAFFRTELSGMSLRSYLTPGGSSDSDPLAQRRKVGHKLMWKSAILENAYFARIETEATNSAGLAA